MPLLRPLVHSHLHHRQVGGDCVCECCFFGVRTATASQLCPSITKSGEGERFFFFLLICFIILFAVSWLFPSHTYGAAEASLGSLLVSPSSAGLLSICRRAPQTIIRGTLTLCAC